jgi:PAS domain S-box-containing protein
MFERSADAILLLDTRTNLFIEYNQAALEMLRCSREELSALHPSVLSPAVQPDGQESFKKANAMIATAVREGSHRFEWVHRSPHRDDFPVEVLLTPLPLGDASIVVVVWRDITERRRSEEALRQAQRLESLAVLAGGIAHDFNNLLTATFGHLHVARRLVTDPRVTTHLESIEQAVTRAADLTRQMLAYGGEGRFMIEPVDLGALVRDMTDLLHVSISKHVQITCEVANDTPAIEADRVQMQQVIMNLITNAGEAIGDADGAISIHVTPIALAEETARRDFVGQDVRFGPMVMLEVRDTGAGMPPEVQTRIFDPFFSTKASGRGLGLSALRGILRAHGAGVRIESEVGHGTTFQVLFPASKERARPSIGPVSAARGEGTVLLVDDEENVRVSLRAVFEQLGFTVVEAAGGAEAIEKFRQKRAAISWVFMDLTMPRMDGHATFLALREIDPAVIVVLSSGWAESEVARRFAGHPPSGFLAKPFTLDELQVTLARLGLMRATP